MSSFSLFCSIATIFVMVGMSNGFYVENNYEEDMMDSRMLNLKGTLKCTSQALTVKKFQTMKPKDKYIIDLRYKGTLKRRCQYHFKCFDTAGTQVPVNFNCPLVELNNCKATTWLSTTTEKAANVKTCKPVQGTGNFLRLDIKYDGKTKNKRGCVCHVFCPAVAATTVAATTVATTAAATTAAVTTAAAPTTAAATTAAATTVAATTVAATTVAATTVAATTVAATTVAATTVAATTVAATTVAPVT